MLEECETRFYKHMEKKKIILDLCGGTGSWARPYKEAGYRVATITLPDFDIRKTKINDGKIWFQHEKKLYDVPVFTAIDIRDVHGILAAPPCTMFSFARTNAKKPRDLKEGMECVKACLEIIWACMEVRQDTAKKTLPLAWWALENPYHGLLRKFLGKPVFTFDPYEFGDGYKKRTALWGNFTEPRKVVKFDTPRSSWSSKKFDRLKSNEIHAEFFGKYDRTTRRSITPPNFAKAFFKVNP